MKIEGNKLEFISEKYERAMEANALHVERFLRNNEHQFHRESGNLDYQGAKESRTRGVPFEVYLCWPTCYS